MQEHVFNLFLGFFGIVKIIMFIFELRLLLAKQMKLAFIKTA